MIQPIGKTKSLLIVSFSYSPMLNPRAFRWTALAEEFARRGVRVHVVCSWQPGLASNETVNGVEIHRVGNHFVERSRAFLARYRRRGFPSEIESTLKVSGPPFAAKLIRWVWRKTAWPDTTCVWYYAALNKVNALLLSMPKATVVTVSPTFTSTLIGNNVARKGKSGRWVLDLGDPFSLAIESPANNFFLYGALNARVERALFNSASAVTLTNSSVQRKYRELYPECAKKLFVIPPLLPVMQAVPPKKTKAIPGVDAAIELIYVGSLYKSLRRPDYMLELFIQLTKSVPSRRIELHFFGDTNECNDAFNSYRDQIGKTIFLHGHVTREQAFEAIANADVVINLGNTNYCQLPSKLVEYMVLEKPILNITQTDADPSLDIMQGYNNPTLTLLSTGTVPTAEQIQKTAVFIEQSASAGEMGCDDAYLEKFKLAPIADQYDSLLFGE